MKAKIYCDGASRGNPGDAGIGCLIILDNKKIEISEYIGKTTNNVAEYTALIRGLEEALKERAEEIEIISDSELLVRQINGIYKVKNKKLIPLYERVKELLNKFKKYQIFHVYRENNFIADSLAKEASCKQQK
ncbi:ribonuclease HI family protein [Thermodesulfovibrio thiophilus]|uniref:ribonuclease HI family protein n=1 Tax=Thermodesulfovibrio thiophilus TaxID=340095 RepID=UPI0018275181|nr:ribonuclease HI family protein [Thermodesulfovibrio thiophilus]HHW19660.1 ribonuclease HI family protein [Thermodesulfovibrio thiophilus]HOA83149.1 ribonuclease HI family protein [Thermodesulfovibrio thiophilus]